MKPVLLVLAAGLGSRFGGIKQLEAVGKNNECLLDYSTYDAFKSGYDKVIYIIRKDIEKDFKDRLFDKLKSKYGDKVDYTFQEQNSLLTDEQKIISKSRTKPWGTLHAILCAKEKIGNSPFAVINADDFYGREALKILSNYLNANPTEHSMVGYKLGNTMSKNGSVSRGICTVNNGYLKSIEENKNIYYKGKKIITENQDKVELTGEEFVSMNLFGFTPKIFEFFENYWKDFINNNVQEMKAECLIPIAIGDMLNKNQGKVKFFTTNETWFGMTYSADKQVVKEEIEKKIKEGIYPEIL